MGYGVRLEELRIDLFRLCVGPFLKSCDNSPESVAFELNCIYALGYQEINFTRNSHKEISNEEGSLPALYPSCRCFLIQNISPARLPYSPFQRGFRTRAIIMGQLRDCNIESSFVLMPLLAS